MFGTLRRTSWLKKADFTDNTTQQMWRRMFFYKALEHVGKAHIKVALCCWQEYMGYISCISKLCNICAVFCADLKKMSAFLPSGQREQTSVLMTGIQCQFLVLRPGWWCQGWNLEQSTSSVCWHKTSWARAHLAKL